LLSFSIKNTSCKLSGILTSNGASVLFFGFHSIFAIFDPSGKGLPFTRDAGLVSGDHRRIGDHHLEQCVRLAHGNDLPVFVPLEIGEWQPVGHLQRVLILRGACTAPYRKEQSSKRSSRHGESGAENVCKSLSNMTASD
jgi:hypothetical protein